MRHTPEHDVWAPDGRCDVLVMEADGTVTRCGYVPGRASFDASQVPLSAARPKENHSGRNALVALVFGLAGVAIALDWLAFALYVTRNETDPQWAAPFIMRVAVSGGYVAAGVWLWRRR